MPIELWGLVALALLILVYVSVQSMVLKSSVGNAWTVGARDQAANASPVAGRAKRATANLLETAPAFICLAVVSVVAGRTNTWTEMGTTIYIVGRTAYLPAYLSGIPWLRTIIWNISTAAIAAMLAGIFVHASTSG